MSDEKVIISWSKVIADALQLSKQLKDIDNIITVSRGGCIPGALLAYQLNVKNVVNFAIQSYNDDKTQANIVVQQYPDSDFLLACSKKKVLVVDDLSDKGTTLAFIQRYLNSYKIYPLFCTLYTKSGTALKPDYFIEEYESNVWIEFPWDNLSDSLSCFTT